MPPQSYTIYFLAAGYSFDSALRPVGSVMVPLHGTVTGFIFLARILYITPYTEVRIRPHTS